MAELWDELTNPTFTPFPVIMGRLLFAAVLGALVGFERERRDRPAGFRTHILVCTASAIFALIVVEITQSPVFRGEHVRFDPIRMVEAVTAGVAFLAAGLIIFKRGEIKGLTTGAGLWFAGAIGVCCGLGFWQVAAFATLMVIMILGLLGAIRFGDKESAPGRLAKTRQEPAE